MQSQIEVLSVNKTGVIHKCQACGMREASSILIHLFGDNTKIKLCVECAAGIGIMLVTKTDASAGEPTHE